MDFTRERSDRGARDLAFAEAGRHPSSSVRLICDASIDAVRTPTPIALPRTGTPRRGRRIA
jgi:hypothetical protein